MEQLIYVKFLRNWKDHVSSLSLFIKQESVSHNPIVMSLMMIHLMEPHSPQWCAIMHVDTRNTDNFESSKIKPFPFFMNFYR